MSDQPLPKKIRAARPGQPVCEVARFKEAWRKLFSDEFKLEFLGWFESRDVSLAEIRLRVQQRCGINLLRTDALTGAYNLRQWGLRELANANEARTAAEDQAQLALEHPDWDSERLRQELLDRMKRRALRQGDFKLGLQAVAQDVKNAALQLDRDKFKESLRTKLAAGLAELAKHIKGNAAAKAAYEAFRATIKETTK